MKGMKTAQYPVFAWLRMVLLFGLWGGLSAAQPMQAPIRPAFGWGEYMKFRVHYGFVTAGYVSLQVQEEPVMVGSHPCYHIVGLGWTHPGFDWFYRIRDRYETYMDTTELLTRRFNRHIVEGGFESYTETHFDQAAGQARYIDHKKRERFFEVPAGIQDVISAFYYARSRYDAHSLQIGDRISLRNFLDRKTFQLEAKLLSREQIKVEGVTYSALKFDLLIEEAGMITDGSTIQFWISEDEQKLPLRIESDLMIGSLKADLMEVRRME
ncbi:MAG: DUF3108 domain-containing protein [Bacteroidetes bacterium]|nr:MAG: DUF3108 domain-containing protein [Bacteroidota bacterium]